MGGLNCIGSESLFGNNNLSCTWSLRLFDITAAVAAADVGGLENAKWAVIALNKKVENKG